MADDPRKLLGDYEVGYGKPPVHTRFKAGNAGRQRGAKKKQVDLVEHVRRTVSKPIAVRRGQEIVKREVGELVGERLLKMLVNGTSREFEVGFRILQQLAPETVRQVQQDLNVHYHRAPTSDVPQPPDYLFKEPQT